MNTREALQLEAKIVISGKKFKIHRTEFIKDLHEFRKTEAYLFTGKNHKSFNAWARYVSKEIGLTTGTLLQYANLKYFRKCSPSNPQANFTVCGLSAQYLRQATRIYRQKNPSSDYISQNVIVGEIFQLYIESKGQTS